MAFDAVLIHSCTIYRKVPDPSGNVDIFGQPLFTETSVNYSCRFYKKKDGKRRGKQTVNGIEYYSVPLSIMLPASADILKNDKLVTTSEGYAGTYTISFIDPVYGRTSLHHKTADIGMVET